MTTPKTLKDLEAEFLPPKKKTLQDLEAEFLPSEPARTPEPGGGLNTLAGRISAFEGQGREGSPFARQTLRQPLESTLRAADRFVAQPLDAFAESTFRGATFQPQVGQGEGENFFRENVESFRDRNIFAQLGIGLAIDPATIASRLPSAALRAAPRGRFGFAAPEFVGRSGGLAEGPAVRQLAPSQIPPSVRPPEALPRTGPLEFPGGVRPDASGNALTSQVADVPLGLGETRSVGNRGLTIQRAADVTAEDTSVLFAKDAQGDEWTIVLDIRNNRLNASILPSLVGGEVPPISPGNIQPLSQPRFNTSEVRSLLREVAQLFPNADSVSGIRETIGRNIPDRMQNINLAPFRRPVKVDVPTGSPTRNVPIDESPSISVPVDRPSTAIPSQGDLNLFGLHPIEAGLGRFGQLKNTFRETVTARTGIGTTAESDVARPLINERRRVKAVIRSVANESSQRTNAIVRTLKTDQQGRFKNLAGVDPTIRGAPTISDVAARLPRYVSQLTSEQVTAFERLRELMIPFREAVDETGVLLSSRPDIIEGGFYIPRLVKNERTFVGSKFVNKAISGYKQDAEFPSEAFGISQGTRYHSVVNSVSNHATKVGQDALDVHSAKFLAGVADSGGSGTIQIRGLENEIFDADLAAQIQRELITESRIGTDRLAVINALSVLHRGFRSTWDNSAMMIQGLLGLARNPLPGSPYSKAMRVNIRAWMNGGDSAFGSWAIKHDQQLAPGNPNTVQWWTSRGLPIQGSATEFELGQGSLSALGRIPGVARSNRAFGALGDTLRVAWADNELADFIRKGVQGPQLEAEAERIAKAVGGATGVARGRFGGDLGDFFLFAPRFLQARLETLARSVQGLRPGATIEQRIARRAMFQMIGIGTGLTFAANEALGQDTDRRPYIKVKTGTRPVEPYINPETGRTRTTRDVFEIVPNSNFMRVRFGGRDWSLFGTYDSLLRVLMAGAVGDPIGALRPLASGPVSIGIDLITRRDFGGEAIPTNVQTGFQSPIKFAEYVAEQVTPFVAGEVPSIVQQAIEGDVLASATALTGEIIGAKSSQLTRRDKRNAISQAQYSQDYDSLSSTQKSLVRDLNDE